MILSSLRARLAGIFAALRRFAHVLKNGPAGGSEKERPRSAAPAISKPQRAKVTLVAVDPYLVYAYWNIDLARLPEDTKSAALRFHDASELAPGPSFDVDVDLRAPNWYVNLWSAGKSYYADLGVKTAEGEFTRLATSNRVETPRAWPAAAPALVPPPPQSARLPSEPPLAARPSGSGSAAPVVSPLPPAPPKLAQAESPRPLRSEPLPSGSGSAALASTLPISAPPPSPPKPVHADQVLQQKLGEIYALRSWRAVPAVAMAAAAHTAPQPQPVPIETFSQTNVLPLAPGPPPRDLTALAERQFSPGIPSSLWKAI